MYTKLYFTLLLNVVCLIGSKAQDMDSLLNSVTTPKINYTTATFKSTHVLNGQSIERMMEGQLDVRIHHRFGTLNSGAYGLYGIDQSTVFLGLDYGIKDWIMVGIGHTPYEKTYTGYTKFSILRQSIGEKNMPVSLSLFWGTDIVTLKWTDPNRTNYNSSRLSYITQVLVARKFNDNFSLQLSPTYIHKNLVAEAIDPNDVYALGIGGRYKLSRRISVNAEYFYNVHPNLAGKTYNPNSLSFGFDIETGGHVFQIMLTNSQLMTERGFIDGTTGTWKNGDIHLGFNISRVFTLY